MLTHLKRQIDHVGSVVRLHARIMSKSDRWRPLAIALPNKGTINFQPIVTRAPRPSGHRLSKPRLAHSKFAGIHPGAPRDASVPGRRIPIRHLPVQVISSPAALPCARGSNCVTVYRKGLTSVHPCFFFYFSFRRVPCFFLV